MNPARLSAGQPESIIAAVVGHAEGRKGITFGRTLVVRPMSRCVLVSTP